MRMTVEHAAALIGAGIQGAENATLLGAEVDSRRLDAGDLFVALPGENSDGHQYVSEALKTCTAALVRRSFSLDNLRPGKALLRVENTLQAYQALAAAERARQSWKVLAITGSVGKTSTKDFLLDILRSRFHAGASSGNRNSTLGLPAELLSQKNDAEIFIAEAGMNHVGELRLLGEILQPDILVYTRIAAVHTAFFSSMESLVEAKAELIPFLSPAGSLVLNADDPYQEVFKDRCTARLLSYGLQNAEVSIESLQELGLGGTEARLRIGSDTAEFKLQAPGRHQLMNFLAAAAGAFACGMTVDEIARAASGLNASEHRGQVHHLNRGISLIDDSYNASPIAMEEALRLLSKTPGRRIAVLGEMLELGNEAAEAHRLLGALAAESADQLLAVGGDPARQIIEGARASGMSSAHSFHAPDAGEAFQILDRTLEAGDFILVKASRAIQLDQLVEQICGEQT